MAAWWVYRTRLLKEFLQLAQLTNILLINLTLIRVLFLYLCQVLPGAAGKVVQDANLPTLSQKSTA